MFPVFCGWVCQLFVGRQFVSPLIRWCHTSNKYAFSFTVGGKRRCKRWRSFGHVTKCRYSLIAGRNLRGWQISVALHTCWVDDLLALKWRKKLKNTANNLTEREPGQKSGSIPKMPDPRPDPCQNAEKVTRWSASRSAAMTGASSATALISPC
jgi:hypothetical protein